MAEPRKIVALSEIAAGSVEELFFEAMKGALDSIADPNTEWKKERVIRLTVSLSPNEARTAAGVDIECTTKFPGVKPVSTVVYLGKHHGQNAAVEAAPNGDLFTEPKGRIAAVSGAHEDDNT